MSLWGAISICWLTSNVSAQVTRVVQPAPCEKTRGASGVAQHHRGDLNTDHTLQRLLRETEESGETFLLVDVAASRLYVKRRTEVLRECIISAGSGRVLRRGNKAWRFETPRGMFTVLARQRNPVWVMPDWAFAEMGRSVPPAGSPKRRVRGVLGRYALDLGGGYKVHGTPFVGQLGRNVTHGCIRVGADDLQFIWDTAAVGTRVFIR